MFRVRQALKDFLRHAVEQEKNEFSLSLSEIVRRSLNGVLSQPLNPTDARGLVKTERDALDGIKSHHFFESPRYAQPFSSYRYRDTPWVSLTVHLEWELLDGLRREATRLGVKRDELLRGALFATLCGHYDYPPNQYPSEAEVGYTHGSDMNGNPLDPRHPTNRGKELEAIHRLRQLAYDPDAPDVCREVLAKYVAFLRKLQQDHERFLKPSLENLSLDPSVMEHQAYSADYARFTRNQGSDNDDTTH